jgi:hypothetical protein
MVIRLREEIKPIMNQPTPKVVVSRPKYRGWSTLAVLSTAIGSASTRPSAKKRTSAYASKSILVLFPMQPQKMRINSMQQSSPSLIGRNRGKARSHQNGQVMKEKTAHTGEQPVQHKQPLVHLVLQHLFVRLGSSSIAGKHNTKPEVYCNRTVIST